MMDAFELVARRANVTVEEIRSLEQRRTWRSRFQVVTLDGDQPGQRHLRSADGDEVAAKPGELRLVGYSAVFDSDSELLYGFVREQVKRGAFKACLKRGPDVRLLINHEGAPFARTTNGTLELEEKPRGLFRNALLDGRRNDARDLYYGVERGDFSQSSFAFTIARSEWRYCEHVESQGDDYYGCDCVWERDILEIGELYDDSVVTYPAYPEATAEVARTADDAGAPVATSESRDDTPEVARESEPTGERHELAIDEEQPDTAPDPDASTRTGSDPMTSQRQRRARLARIRGNRNEVQPGTGGGAR